MSAVSRKRRRDDEVRGCQEAKLKKLPGVSTFQLKKIECIDTNNKVVFTQKTPPGKAIVKTYFYWNSLRLFVASGDDRHAANFQEISARTPFHALCRLAFNNTDVVLLDTQVSCESIFSKDPSTSKAKRCARACPPRRRSSLTTQQLLTRVQNKSPLDIPLASTTRIKLTFSDADSASSFIELLTEDFRCAFLLQALVAREQRPTRSVLA